MNTQKIINLFSTKADALAAINLLIIFNADDDTHWIEIKKEIESFDDKGLAKKVLDFFNETCETNYSNTEKIKAVIRQIPKVTFAHFESVILHKKEKWGNDPEMRQYLRPATLFGSKNKFMTYWEDANEYWILKSKQNGGQH